MTAPPTGGNGAHTHISVHGGTNTPRAADASRAATLTPTERSFLQGVLTHLPAICALTLPNAASYARMLDGIWSGGTYACWGTDNREVPLRLCGPAGGHHLEVKCVDGTATPHLVFAGLIAAGLRGIVGGEVLATGDCAKAVYAMSITERRAVGLENAVKLPQTIQDARASLGADVGMKGLLGEEFVETYLSVNEVSLRVDVCASFDILLTGLFPVADGEVHDGQGREGDGEENCGVLLMDVTRICSIMMIIIQVLYILRPGPSI